MMSLNEDTKTVALFSCLQTIKICLLLLINLTHLNYYEVKNNTHNNNFISINM